MLISWSADSTLGIIALREINFIKTEIMAGSFPSIIEEKKYGKETSIMLLVHFIL